MTFHYELVPEDSAAFASNSYGGARASAKVGNSRFVYVVLVAGLILLKLSSGERPGVGDAVLLVIALAWGLAMPWKFRRKMAAHMRTASQSDMSRSALGYRVLTVDEGGVTEQTELGSSHRTWAPDVDNVVSAA
jgi:hypothetical protein